jgi:hypothetical protein
MGNYLYTLPQPPTNHIVYNDLSEDERMNLQIRNDKIIVLYKDSKTQSDIAIINKYIIDGGKYIIEERENPANLSIWKYWKLEQ